MNSAIHTLRILSLALLATSLTLLTACGQTGELRLPEDKPAKHHQQAPAQNDSHNTEQE